MLILGPQRLGFQVGAVGLLMVATVTAAALAVPVVLDAPTLPAAVGLGLAVWVGIASLFSP